MCIILCDRAKDDPGSPVRVFETPQERIRRRLSLVIINIVSFISTMGFSIVLTGAYPYLLQVSVKCTLHKIAR